MSIDLTPARLLTSLIDSISNIPTPRSSTGKTTSVNPLKNLPPNFRNLFTTAHCLLPSTFLASLDLLDKHLVVKALPVNGQESLNPEEAVFYIRSSHPYTAPIAAPKFLAVPTASNISIKPKQSSSKKTYNYEVRPVSWNCTCIAFTLAAYSNVHQYPVYPYQQNNLPPEDVEMRDASNEEEDVWWGGLSLPVMNDRERQKSIPICKHLLAAVLGMRCENLFGEYVAVRKVGKEEMAELGVLWD